MLIGQDRAGKTSLKKSLRGEPFNPNEESTVGVHKDPSHFQVTTEIWKAGEKDEAENSDAHSAISYENHAAKLIASSLMMAPIPSETLSLDSDDASADKGLPISPIHFQSPQTCRFASKENPNLEERAVEHVQSRGFSITNVDLSASSREFSFVTSETPNTLLQDTETWDVPRDNSSSIRGEPEVPYDIATLVEKILCEGTKVEDEDVYSGLWDFGGQSVYYVTHPLFLTPRAIYVLVNNLSRNPWEKANHPDQQEMFDGFKDEFCLKSNLDYLDYWMTSVASISSLDEDHQIRPSPKYEALPEKLPPVFLVCSHADKPHGGMDPCSLANKIFDCLQVKPYSKHLVEHVYVVNNTLSGSTSECPEVVRLRQDILTVAQKLPHMKEVIPVRWLKYERALHMTEKDGHKWISLESAKQIASEVCRIVNNQEFLTLLNFLHDQRIVIHFDDTPELCKFVVLDPQWLINVFSKVITVQPDIRKDRKFRQLWHKLETTGILEDRLLEHVWGPLLDNRETFESLIAIMEKFNLLCLWPSSEASSSKQYLVPSMLMSHPPQEFFKLVASAQIPSLFLRFEGGQIPPGLFPRLMLQFFQWGKDELWSSVNPHLYQNLARFYTTGDQDCSVILLCHSSSIEVVVHRGNLSSNLADSLHSKLKLGDDTFDDSFEKVCAPAVHRQLSLMLESMRKEFCWLANMRYEAGVICPICCRGGAFNYCRTHRKQGCERGECLHFLSESELRIAKQFIVCNRSAVALNNKVHVNQFAAWFGCPIEQVSLLQLQRSIKLYVEVIKLYICFITSIHLTVIWLITIDEFTHLISNACSITLES